MPSLSSKQRSSLYALLRYYRREERRAARARAYLAAVVMLGCQIETALLLMVDANEEDLVAAATKKGVKVPADPLIQWNLGMILPLVSGVGWLATSWVRRKRSMKRKLFHQRYTLLRTLKRQTRWQVGDWVHFLRVLRNLVHPGRYTRENPERTVYKAEYDVAVEVFDVTIDWLEHHNLENLRRRIDAH